MVPFYPQRQSPDLATPLFSRVMISVSQAYAGPQSARLVRFEFSISMTARVLFWPYLPHCPIWKKRVYFSHLTRGVVPCP